MTRIIKELRIPVGKTKDGAVEWRSIGYVVEDDFGKDNKRHRYKINVDVLNPQLFALVRSGQADKSAFVYAEGTEMAKRYKDPSAVPSEEEMAEANGNGGGE